MLTIRQIADKLGINKDYALRLVRKRAGALGLHPHIGSRRSLSLSSEDADRLVADHLSRRAQPSAHTSNVVRVKGFGYFYVIQLHPEDLPTRVKIGYTDNLDVRQSDHRTTAPTLRVLGAWPCKRAWEEAAKASVTRERCTVQGFLDRAEAFFRLMPSSSHGA